MATILVQTLVDQVRVESDLNRSQAVKDPDIATMISDAGSDLYDQFTQTNQLYNVKQFDFTLPGGVGGNTVTLPADFQQGHSVDVNPDSAQPYTLKYLSNWLDRNRNSAPSSIWGPSVGPRSYCFLDNQLVVFPAQNAGGTFRLYYTPQWQPLQIPTTATITVASADGCFDAGGLLAFNLQNLTMVPEYVGATLTTNFGAPNTGLNATYTVDASTPITALYVITTTPYSSQTITLPNSGTATVRYQPAGTRPDLPTQMNPWIEYLKTGACITIRNKRGQDVSAFERKLAVMKDRIEAILQERQMEPTQPPLTRSGGFGWFGGGSDW